MHKIWVLIITALVPISLLFGSSIIFRDDVAPAALTFIPGDATAVLTIRPLRETWQIARPHLELLFGGSRTDLGQAAKDIQLFLRSRCLKITELSDFAGLGIDTAQPWAAGMSRLTQNMVVAPISDYGKFKRFLATLQAENRELVLTPSSGVTDVTGFAITQNIVGDGFLCGGDGQYVTSDIVPAVGGKVQLTFVVPVPVTTQTSLELSCQAIRADGTTSGCTCQVNGAAQPPPPLPPPPPATAPATTSRNQLPTTNSPEERSTLQDPGNPRCTVSAELTFAQNVPQKREWEINNPKTDKIGSLYLLQTELGYVILSDSDFLLKSALETKEENLAAHRRQLARLRESGLFPPFTSSSNQLQGYISMPSLSMYPVPIWLKIDKNVVKLAADVGISTWSAKILQVLGDPSQDSFQAVVIDGAGLAVAVKNDHLSYIVRYSLDYIEGASDALHRTLGSFDIAVDAIADAESVRNAALSMIGSRNGVPELAMTMRIEKAEDTERILTRTQTRLRQIRDWAIVDGATKAYTSDPSHPLPPTTVNDLRPYITGEDVRHFAYMFGSSPGAIRTTKVPPELLHGPDYAFDQEGMSVRYLSPKITDDDFIYRLSGSDLDAAGRAALLRDKYRICATYLSEERLLVVSTDAETLLKAVKSGTVRKSSDFINVLGRLGGTGATMIGFALPDWAIAQGLLHADPKINMWTRKFFSDLSQYRLSVFTITPHREQKRARFSLELSR